MLKIQDMFELEVAKICYKFNNGTLPLSFNSVFHSTNHVYNTRGSQVNLLQQHFNKSSGYKTMAFLGAKIWNDIPLIIRQDKNFINFSRKLKKHLLINYI